MGLAFLVAALYPALVLIHVFRANALWHHAVPGLNPGLVREWLPSVRHSIALRSTERLALFARPGRRIKLLMSEAHQMTLMRGELPIDHPAPLPAHELAG